MLVPFLATQDWIRSLNYSIIDHWRPWLVHNQVAGYYSTIFFSSSQKHICEDHQFGGGHTIEYKPDENSVMFERWVSGQPL
ncbi:unnamed protein product [Brassica rapa subsp. trilocularis]